MQRTIKLERVLPHSPETVWHALTDQHMLGTWFMQNDIEPRLHQEFTFSMKPQKGWDGLTHCKVIELIPLQRLAYTYRGEASGEKPLACAGIDSPAAEEAVKGIFAQLDTVLRFTLTPVNSSDGVESTRLTLEHSGFKGVKLMVISLVMGYGWRKQLRRLSALLDTTSTDQSPIRVDSSQTVQER